MAIDRAQQAKWGRIGGFRLAATRDPKVYTAAAREAFLAGFNEGHSCRLCGTVSMPLGLAESEVERRARAIRREHFARLAIASSRARSKGKAPGVSARPGAPSAAPVADASQPTSTEHHREHSKSRAA